MLTALRPLTYDDYLQLPDDGKRYEVIGGELIVNPAPRRIHQEVSSNLDWILQRSLRASGAARLYTHPVDVYLSLNDIVQPDLVVIRTSRLHIYQPEGVIKGAPDIVIEIISPSSQRVDRVRKQVLYARSGVPEYWIADPEQRELIVNVLRGEDYVAVEPDGDGLFSSRVIPGLRVDPG
jgi:Uma2 family endonuclease